MPMFMFYRPHLKYVFFQKLRHILNLPGPKKLLIRAQKSKLISKILIMGWIKDIQLYNYGYNS